MPIVGIPSLLRDLTDGQKSLSVEGDTVRKVIENLEKLHPGIQERLCDGERLRPSIAVIVDGHTSTLKLRHQLQESSEIHFVISISGGKFQKDKENGRQANVSDILEAYVGEAYPV